MKDLQNKICSPNPSFGGVSETAGHVVYLNESFKVWEDSMPQIHILNIPGHIYASPSQNKLKVSVNQMAVAMATAPRWLHMSNACLSKQIFFKKKTFQTSDAH